MLIYWYFIKIFWKYKASWNIFLKDAENVKYSVITGSTKERSEQIMKIVGINKPIVQPVREKEVEVKNK